MTTNEANTRDRLSAADAAQLRTDAETTSAIIVTSLGPLHLATFIGGRGFITYRDLGEATADAIRLLIPEALSY